MPTGHRLYVSNPNKCRHCPLLNQCTESKDAIKQIRRHVWQNDLDIMVCLTQYIFVLLYLIICADIFFIKDGR